MSAIDSGIAAIALPDLERRVANMVRYGVVHQVDYANKRVKIKSGEIVTAWLKWPAASASSFKRTWTPPAVGEQVVLLSPTGDLRQATILPGQYQNSYDAPSVDPDTDLAQYSDGTKIEYNRSTQTYTIESTGHVVIKGAQTLLIDFGGDVTINTGGNALVNVSGNATVNSASTTINSPTTNNGNVSINGNLSVSGVTTTGGLTSTGAAGGASITGNMNINGGTLTNNGVNIGSTHVHIEQGDGAPTSTPQ